MTLSGSGQAAADVSFDSQVKSGGWRLTTCDSGSVTRAHFCQKLHVETAKMNELNKVSCTT